MITETLATHDRRTQDTGIDPTGKKVTDPSPNDDDFDQKFKPQGSLFIELYNPNSGNSPSNELYVDNNDADQGGVFLQKETPDEGNGTNPVWRIAISEVIGDTQANLEASLNLEQPTVERAIYFTNSSTIPPAAASSVDFYPDNQVDDEIAPIQPGRYAVIGPGSREQAQVVPFGR